MKNDLILIGGGGHCKSCIDVIETENKYNIKGIVDLPEKMGESILNYKIIACDDDLPKLSKQHTNFIITIGQIRSAAKRIRIFNLLNELNVSIPVIISPLAYVSRYASIDKGTIIMHHVIVNTNASIGFNCIINNKALIEHDAIIGNHCHISTGAIVNGGVIIEDETFYGSGAVTKENSRIKKGSFIKAHTIYKD